MLTTDNSRCLEQAKKLLKSCPPDLYCQKTANCFNSSIGEHLRHILDHYSCFFRDLPDARFNYDLRERNPLLKTSKTVVEKKLTVTQCIVPKPDVGQRGQGVEICENLAQAKRWLESAREIAFAIGKENQEQGLNPMGLVFFLRHWRRGGR